MKKRVTISGVEDFKDASGSWVASYTLTTHDAHIQHQTRSYVVWNSINTRLSKRYKALHPSYDESLCLFENYQIFAEWCQLQHGYLRKDKNGAFWNLDKDLLKLGNKDYSPDTCVFIPQRINKLLTTRAAKRGKHPLGVCYDKETGKYIAACRDGKKALKLGRFVDEFEAHRAWQLAKIKQLVKATVDDYLSDKVKAALTERANKIQGEYNNGKETIFV